MHRGSLSLSFAVLALTLACAPAVVVPPPCAGNDTIYASSASSAEGPFRAATIAQPRVPPAEFRGTAVLRLLIDPRGQVLSDSTTVKSADPKNAPLLKRWAAAFQFRPATLGLCAVSSWYELTITR